MGKGIRSVRSGRGRPRKTQEIIGSMVMVHAPEVAGEALFASSDKFADPIEELGIEAKLDRISQVISGSARKVGAQAKLAGDELAAGERDLPGLTGVRATSRPWLEKKPPVNVFSDAKRAIHANGRVIDTLIRHLVEHVAIEQELREIATDARHRAADELRDIPLAMVDFVNRLMASGVVATDVRFMPRDRLAHVVAAIKGVNVDVALEDVPDNLPPSSWVDLESGLADQAAERAPEARANGLSGDAGGSEMIDSVAFDGPDATASSLRADGVPLCVERGTGGGLWDVVDVSTTGYRIEEYATEPEGLLVVEAMQLPEARSMRLMAPPQTLDETLAVGAEVNGISAHAERFVGRFCRNKSIDLSEEERRLWLFLLFEINAPEASQMGRSGFFDGVRMPGPAGAGRMLRLVAIDRDHLEDAAPAQVLAGPAHQRP